MLFIVYLIEHNITDSTTKVSHKDNKSVGYLTCISCFKINWYATGQPIDVNAMLAIALNVNNINIIFTLIL
jgi:hypothetical protein